MKFGKTLKQEREYMDAWAENFVSYSRLKKLIGALRDAAKKGDAEAKARHQKEFFDVIRADLYKVNTFYECILEALTEPFEELCDDFAEHLRDCRESHSVASQREQKLKALYEKLSLLAHYCNVNRTGFRKIMKKYDKKLHEAQLSKFMFQEVHPLAFSQRRDVTKWIAEIERMYAQTFTDGNREEAVKRLAYLRVHVQLATKNKKGLMSVVGSLVSMFKTRPAGQQ